jgi:predicted nucleic acid-binding protein
MIGARLTTSSSYLVDTGILIRHLRGDARASNLLRNLRSVGQVTTSAMVAFEVMRGARNGREERAAEELFNLVPPADTNLKVAQTAANIARSNKGILIGDRAALDALITGTAVVTASTLVTLNSRQFSRLRVPRLKVLLLDQHGSDWTVGL